MTEIDLNLIRSYLKGVEPQGRTALLPALHKAQELYGYLPEDVSAEVSRALKVPLADVHGVIDFYALFTREAQTKKTIHVCRDPACALAGADRLTADLSQALGGSNGAEVEEIACLGLCDQAPAALVGETEIVHADRVSPADLLTGKTPESRTFTGGDISVLTANCNRGRATSLPEYVASGGYAGLAKALALGPAAVVAEVKASGLVGRGGAAFPAGVKWEGAAQAAGEPKYVVCNADESEPGTFKDRVMMENDPHRILEGLLIAGYAIE
ncbi:MAG: NAD(P)H-dependent oxidoreductase subunit E, partial [Chloroflexi bacterium]|nr:NAD(P)H-dependent oxidoreductase subunit E [Chloroflexota bacterium]